MATTRRTQLIVKVDPKLSKEPAKHVTRVLKSAGKRGRVEELFPGLVTGSSAGLVSVTLADAAASKRAVVKALRDDEAIRYVETPKPRRPL